MLFYQMVDVAAPIQRGSTVARRFFHQPILKRPVGTFDAAFGLRTVRAEDLDVQLIQSPANLGHSLAGLGSLVRDA